MQDAIALTWSTLTARLKNLRLGAAGAGLGFLVLLLSAVWFRSGWALAGLPALMGLGYAFFRRDFNLVYRWEDSVLASWGASDLCMGILIQTFRDHPGPLKATLKGMIAHLPPNPDFLLPPSDAIKAERALLYARGGTQRARLDRAAALNLALSAVPFCAWLAHRQDPRLWPAGLLPLALIPPWRAWLMRRETLRFRRSCAALAPWNPSAAADLPHRFEALDWTRLPRRVRTSWADSLRDPQ